MIRPIHLRLQLVISAHRKLLSSQKNHDLVTHSKQLFSSMFICCSLILGIALFNSLLDLLYHRLPIFSYILCCNTNSMSSRKLDQIKSLSWYLRINNGKGSLSCSAMNWAIVSELCLRWSQIPYLRLVSTYAPNHVPQSSVDHLRLAICLQMCCTTKIEWWIKHPP